MKLRNILLSTGFALTTSAAYIIGYDTGTESQKPIINDLSKEVRAYKNEASEAHATINDLHKRIEIQDKMLANPVVKAATNLKISPDANVARFTISAYSPYDDVNGINSEGDPSETATGTTPRPGTFAVDPKVIPYGAKVTILYPDGTVEHGIAEDTGGAIDNNRIDVFRYKFNTAMDFGMKDAVVFWEEI